MIRVCDGQSRFKYAYMYDRRKCEKYDHMATRLICSGHSDCCQDYAAGGESWRLVPEGWACDGDDDDDDADKIRIRMFDGESDVSLNHCKGP